MRSHRPSCVDRLRIWGHTLAMHQVEACAQRHHACVRVDDDSSPDMHLQRTHGTDQQKRPERGVSRVTSTVACLCPACMHGTMCHSTAAVVARPACMSTHAQCPMRVAPVTHRLTFFADPDVSEYPP
jgi:hypothetical protein